MMGLFLDSRRNWAERGRRARYRSDGDQAKRLIGVLRETKLVTRMECCANSVKVEVEVEVEVWWLGRPTTAIARSRYHVTCLAQCTAAADWLRRIPATSTTFP